MKYWQLLEISEYIKEFSEIRTIFRIDYQTLQIEFDKGEKIRFNMRRGESFIYKSSDEVRSEKIFSPFDTQLSSRFQKSKIDKIEILNGDKILKISVSISNKYKKLESSLQLEFTGKHTNIILLDSENRVLEALHHISEFKSVRPVKVGEFLGIPPKPNFEFKTGEKLENVEDFLKSEWRNYISKKLEKSKKREILKVEKKIDKLKKSFEVVRNSEIFFEKADRFSENAQILLANLYSLPKYGDFETYDFSGNLRKIERPKEARDNNHMIQIFFDKSKKFRKKGENSEIERTNLIEKIDFLERMTKNIRNSSSLSELDILSNRGKDRREKRQKNELYEVFWIEGYKILLGKSERGNEALLKDAKSRDIWLHMKDIPSAHTLIVTDKQSIPENVIFEAGKLCLKFSVKESGKYLIDYTKRRNVRIQSGANVLYTDYKTIEVEI
ncbi:putative RNA-binding protein, snRNP like protein [Thiovulum sp. ES]|nr:putative RNA-binding protein, snRNP like protein [Thiovulum sp. ES]